MMKLGSSSDRIDKVDLQILDLLVQNSSNKHISLKLHIPLSTIQRRVRNLIEKGFIASKNCINFTKFGFTTGTLHVYLSDGNLDSIIDNISKLKGVTSLEVHIGNSDVIAGIAYKEGRDLLDLIAAIKRIEGVERIVWSERILEYDVPSNNVSLLEIEV